MTFDPEMLKSWSKAH